MQKRRAKTVNVNIAITTLNWLYLLAVFEQILGVFLVALFITGFTGMLTRDETV